MYGTPSVFLTEEGEYKTEPLKCYGNFPMSCLLANTSVYNKKDIVGVTTQQAGVCF